MIICTAPFSRACPRTNINSDTDSAAKRPVVHGLQIYKCHGPSRALCDRRTTCLHQSQVSPQPAQVSAPTATGFNVARKRAASLVMPGMVLAHRSGLLVSCASVYPVCSKITSPSLGATSWLDSRGPQVLRGDGLPRLQTRHIKVFCHIDQHAPSYHGWHLTNIQTGQPGDGGKIGRRGDSYRICRLHPYDRKPSSCGPVPNHICKTSSL